MSLKLEIVTSEKNIFSGDVEYVGVKSADGELGILSKHVPLITELVEGKVTWRVNNKNDEVNISGGFLEVVNNKVNYISKSFLTASSESQPQQTIPAPI